MARLTPDEIENLLHQGARRNEVTVDRYREMISEIAEKQQLEFVQALYTVDFWEKLSEDKREMFRKGFSALQEESAQLGCTMDQAFKAYGRILADPSFKPN